MRSARLLVALAIVSATWFDTAFAATADGGSCTTHGNCVSGHCAPNNLICCHGGLSPELTVMEQVKKIVRPCDVADTGLICDLLWSDPNADVHGWGENDRGVSYTFGEDIVDKFLRKHDFDLICRAHQVVEDGYQFFAKRQLITIFSAPNYCGEFDNAGAMMSVDETLMCSFQILKPAEKRWVSRRGLGRPDNHANILTPRNTTRLDNGSHTKA